jgi:flavin-dependent dehydrogenase
METLAVDVAIVGAGLAGCTAALLYAQQGLEVALLERHPRSEAAKRLCTHWVQAGAVPILTRLGLLPALEAAGAVRYRSAALWTRWGWLSLPDRMPEGAGFNLRRARLDPLLRQHAMAAPGVRLLLGQRVQALETDATGRVMGVVSRDQTGRVRMVRARLVVGADGRGSPLATLAGLPAHARPNGRGALFTLVAGLAEGTPRCWLTDDAVAMLLPTDSGLTVTALYLPPATWAAVRSAGAAGLLRWLAALPDAPALDAARVVAPLRGYGTLPNLARPLTRPGLALIGDAACALDPVFAAGCSHAIASAAWLVDATASALRAGADLDRELQAYRRAHAAQLSGWRFALTADLSRGRPLTAVERLCLAAAARDPALLSRLQALTTAGRVQLLHSLPGLLGRAVWTVIRGERGTGRA